MVWDCVKCGGKGKWSFNLEIFLIEIRVKVVMDHWCDPDMRCLPLLAGLRLTLWSTLILHTADCRLQIGNNFIVTDTYGIEYIDETRSQSRIPQPDSCFNLQCQIWSSLIFLNWYKYLLCVGFLLGSRHNINNLLKSLNFEYFQCFRLREGLYSSFFITVTQGRSDTLPKPRANFLQLWLYGSLT